MKIYLCIAGDGNIDSTEIRCGRKIEVGQIPKIGETIKLKLNLFDFIFANIHSDYKNNIIFHNHSVSGIVVDVVHSFKAMNKPTTKLFPTARLQELCSSIDPDSDAEVMQLVFVVVKFNN